jgi:FAD/FMN-containing dehydrogenase
MNTTLPPALSELGLSAALEGFTAALGSARVLTGEADLKLYRDPFQHASSQEYTASAVLMPETVEEIQALVRIRFCETLKDALDPAGILSPGKQGIWPRSMRGDGRAG